MNPYEHKTFKHPFNIDNVKIDINPSNGGLCSFFYYNGRQYFADLADIMLIGTECMIFHSCDREVTDYMELYCKRGVEVTDDNLRACILEFVEQLAEEEK